MVDLPDPDCPRSASISPSRISRLMSSSTVTGDPPSALTYDFDTCRSSISGAKAAVLSDGSSGCDLSASEVSVAIGHPGSAQGEAKQIHAVLQTPRFVSFSMVSRA